jgi:PAS domain S-box-containing protein
MSVVGVGSLSTYARVLDALPIVSWLAEIDGTVVYVSPRWESLTGNRAADVRDAAYGAFIHPDDAPSALATWAAARERLAPYRDEVRVLCGDGSYRWMLSEANPLRTEDGELIGWLGTVADVHDHRVAWDLLARRNELLQAAEERHRLTAEAIPGTSWTATPDGKLDFVLDGGYALPRRAAIARMGADWLDGVHDEDREAAR